MDAPVTDALRGVVLDGRYRIDRPLATGGMSTVWVATDLRLDRPVAVKIMDPGLARDPAFVQRFVREARGAARLSHINVVAVLDQGFDGEHAFLVMELVRGRTLRDLLLERGRLTPEEAVAVLEPVLAGLSAAHRSGLVHRDVKPENVLLADDGVVKVADFGLARAVGGDSVAEHRGPLIGTANYLSPEQISTGDAGPAGDVYAAGIVAYEMLTGHPPYAGGPPMSVAFRHVHHTVPPPSFSGAPVPEPLDALVVAATSREVGDRPPDAGTFLAELWDVRSDLGLARVPVPVRSRALEPPPGPPARRGQTAILHPGDRPTAARPARRRRRRWLPVLLVLLLALAAGGAGWWYGEGRWTTVPDLSALSEVQISAAAREAGLDVAFGAPVFDERVPAGQLISADPARGEEVLRGSDIAVVLSKGPERFQVATDLVGQPFEAVRTALAALPVELGRREVYDESVPAGSVVGFDPAAGTALRRGQTVTALVSRGPAPVDVPDVTGTTRDQAVQQVQDAGLVPTLVEAFSDYVAAGLVIGQDPPAGGDPVPRGSTLTVTVSKGPDLVTVPDVGGLSRDQATAVLQAAGFVVDSTCFLSCGDVIDQDPDAGAAAPRASTVQILASF